MNMDELHSVFEREAREFLHALEDIALKLEEYPDDMEIVNEAFRTIHTLKGAGAMYGYDNISDFLHEIETVLDHVRNGQIPVTKKLVDLLLRARDEVMGMLSKSSDDEKESKVRRCKILQGFLALVPPELTADPKKTARKARKKGKAAAEGEEITYRIQFKPEKDFYLRGFNQERIFEEIKKLGWSSIQEKEEKVPKKKRVPDHCYFSWDIIVTTSAGMDALKDNFIFFEEGAEYTIDVIDTKSDDLEEGHLKRLGEILVERGDISTDDLKKALGDRKLIGEYLVSAGLLHQERLASALFEQTALTQSLKARKERDESSTIRVSFERLDSLVDLIGELVAAQASLSQIVSGWDDIDSFSTSSEMFSMLSENNFEVLSRLSTLAEQFERLTKNIRAMTMDMRMVPIGTTFSRYKRLMRDLSHELDRDVKMITEGGETEFDKSIIDRLSEPLIHLIRNAVDHGIESADERNKSGKDPQGTILLQASHAGSYIFIIIKDDGRGLNTEKIASHAIKAGLIVSAEGLSKEEIWRMIFAPGFTTTTELTSVSGRGVGMDVVKKTIESLSGNVHVESVEGKGTTVTLKIPLTLAIIDGLLVKIGRDSYVIPLSIVEECIEVQSGDLFETNRREMVKVRDELIPFINLRKMFSCTDEHPVYMKVAVVNADGMRVGLLVDSIAGKYQTVIKPMGAMYRGIRHISGATILGDGSVALILDANQLVKEVEKEEARFFTNVTHGLE